jgi:hypothetical protein
LHEKYSYLIVFAGHSKILQLYEKLFMKKIKRKKTKGRGRGGGGGGGKNGREKIVIERARAVKPSN